MYWHSCFLQHLPLCRFSEIHSLVAKIVDNHTSLCYYGAGAAAGGQRLPVDLGYAIKEESTCA
jgi:hypothetical protein